LFNRSYCRRRILNKACYDPTQSTSFAFETTSNNNVAKYPFSLQIDGEYVSDSLSVVGMDDSSLTFSILGTLASQSYSDRVPFILSSNIVFNGGDPSYFSSQSFPDNDGLLGMGYSVLARGHDHSAFLSLVASESDRINFPIFSLDVNGASGGTLFLGGIDEQYRSSLEFSNSAASTTGYHVFTLFDMTICGAHLFQSSFSDSSSYDAIVGTGSSCLNLPAEFFDMIASWIPVECETEHFPSDIDDSRVCYLTGSQPNSLPTLSFKLSSDGAYLHIPLENIILLPVPPEPRRRLCMHRGLSLSNFRGSSSPRFSFGNRVLQNLFTTFAMNTNQVGMANKRIFAPSLIQCSSRRQCLGMQSHDESLNMCIDPPCSLYYFFDFDSTNKICVLSSAFHVTCIVMIVIFLVTEIALNEIHSYLANKVYRTISL